MNLIDRIKKMPLGIKIACSAAVVAVIAAVIVVIVLSSNGYVANTMRLLRVEGTDSFVLKEPLPLKIQKAKLNPLLITFDSNPAML